MGFQVGCTSLIWQQLVTPCIEVDDGDGVSQIVYSHSNVYDPGMMRNACKIIDNKNYIT